MPPVISEDESSLSNTPQMSDQVDLEDEEEVEISDENGDEEEDEEDDEEDDDEIDEELNQMVGDKDEDDEDVASASEEEDNYKIEDPDDMDEDLELKDDEDEDAAPVKQAPVRATSYQRQSIETRRRPQMNYYEQDMDDMEEEEEEVDPEPKKPAKAAKMDIQRPEDLDPDLILTDEETEYNPNNHKSRMTERQRGGEDSFMELENDSKKANDHKETEEEVALKKAENARRRLDYKNKQLEEEKRDTLNKLLKRRANKTREVQDPDSKEETKTLKPRRPMVQHPALLRYVNNTGSLQGNSTLSYNLP